MDKETLSHYGWIVILVLILSVMIALATPFGSFVADGFKAGYMGLFDVQTNALAAIIPGSQDDDTNTPTDEMIPGLYTSGSIDAWKSGQDISNRLIKTWDELLEEEIIHVNDGRLISNYVFANANLANNYNNSSDALDGDLIIANGVTEIGNYKISTYDFAFAFCEKLTGVYIPSSVEQLGYYAFNRCTSLKTVYFEDGAVPSTNKVSDSVFWGLSNLETINIPTTWTNIPESFLERCSSIKEITIPASVESIDSRAFQDCTSLATINIPENTRLHTIDEFAFLRTAIATFEVPKTVNFIGWQAFCAAPNLTEITFEDGTNEPLVIDGAIVQGAPKFKKLELPKRTIKLGNNLFSSVGTGTVQIVFEGTRQEYEDIKKGKNMNFEAVYEIVCSDGVYACSSHTGGTATCTERKRCDNCGLQYGYYISHNMEDGNCTVCGIAGTVIETEHNPYQYPTSYTVLGTWDYSDAKSVTITVIYETISSSYDYVLVTKGTDYISGSSQNDSRTYLDYYGDVVNTWGTATNIRFGGKTMQTVTYHNLDMLTGSVIFNGSYSYSSNYYGAKVIITPNY